MMTIDDILTRGVDKVYPSREELKVEISKRKLRIYHGIDPTGELHIGHMVILRKLRQFQDLGHDIIILIGDFTATIGDPTDKKASRQPLTREQILQNSKDYKVHIGKILDLKKSNIRFLYNEEWSNKLKPIDLLKIASQFTVAALLERDMFQERMRKNKDIHVHEFLYPIFQAYDSVTMNVDMEIGGSDQTFNMLMGRKLMRSILKKEKFVMTTPLLEVKKGQKMGKSEGNAIMLSNKPSDLFAKIMALGDEIIVKGLELLTDLPLDEIRQISEDLKNGKNPIGYKKILAFEIVKQLNSHEDAHKAQQEFEKNVQNKVKSLDIPVLEVQSGKPLSEIAIEQGLVTSNSEWKRLFAQKGIRVDDEPLKMVNENLSKEITLQRGRKSIRIKPV